MICIQCGKEFTPNSPSHKLCSDECRRLRSNELCRKRTSKNLNMKWNDEGKTVCEKASTCYYGGRFGNTTMCDYMSKTGMFRGGYPSECTHYKKKVRKSEKR